MSLAQSQGGAVFGLLVSAALSPLFLSLGLHFVAAGTIGSLMLAGMVGAGLILGPLGGLAAIICLLIMIGKGRPILGTASSLGILLGTGLTVAGAGVALGLSAALGAVMFGTALSTVAVPALATMFLPVFCGALVINFGLELLALPGAIAKAVATKNSDSAEAPSSNIAIPESNVTKTSKNDDVFHAENKNILNSNKNDAVENKGQDEKSTVTKKRTLKLV